MFDRSSRWRFTGSLTFPPLFTSSPLFIDFAERLFVDLDTSLSNKLGGSAILDHDLDFSRWPIDSRSTVGFYLARRIKALPYRGTGCSSRSAKIVSIFRKYLSTTILSIYFQSDSVPIYPLLRFASNFSINDIFFLLLAYIFFFSFFLVKKHWWNRSSLENTNIYITSLLKDLDKDTSCYFNSRVMIRVIEVTVNFKTNQKRKNVHVYSFFKTHSRCVRFLRSSSIRTMYFPAKKFILFLESLKLRACPTIRRDPQKD